eukprot:4124173-Amphidinium_carterae.1
MKSTDANRQCGASDCGGEYSTSSRIVSIDRSGGPPPVSSTSLAGSKWFNVIGVLGAVVAAGAARRIRGAPNGSNGPRCRGCGGGLYVRYLKKM